MITYDWLTTTWVAMKNKVAPGIRTREGSNPHVFDKGVIEAIYSKLALLETALSL